MAIKEHLLELAGVSSVRALALSCDLVPSTLVRQLNGERSLQFETIMTVCRRYGAPWLPAAIAGGFITEGEAKTGIAIPSSPGLEPVGSDDDRKGVTR